MVSKPETIDVRERFKRRFRVHSDYLFKNCPLDQVPLWLAYDDPLEALLVEEPYDGAR